MTSQDSHLNRDSFRKSDIHFNFTCKSIKDRQTYTTEFTANVQLRNIFKPLSKVKERKKIIIKKPQQPASQTILLNNKSFEFLRILN
ncbi:CLUMA_CG004395, isoform D [Clunio marinus]|uniref:CLUMA_CG004395, isoform D n=1 Tax=Clunio marinus TaxID=568069 RepID=A0A1J1HRU6_9DIPT|nr:CLUMA_CG004395, isoform D [Clunio marinus]